MRVLHLVWGMEIGGKERFLDSLMRGLDCPGIEQELWTLRGRGSLFEALERDGYRVQCLGKRPGLDPACAVRFRREVRKLAPDVLHVHDFTAALIAFQALRPAERQVMVATSHGGQMVPDLYSGLSDLGVVKRALYRRMLCRVQAVTAVSAQQAEALARVLGGRVAVRHIPYGMDPDRYSRSVDTARKREELGLDADAPVVIMLARLEPPKTPDVVVRAAAKVCAELPKTRFLFVGDGSCRQQIEALAADLKLNGAVRVLGMRTDIAELLAVPNVCVLSSVREGLPLSILEAMASSRPVVASGVGGISELIEDGKEGFTVPPGDSERMAESVLKILRDPLRAAEMGRQARHKLETRYSTSIMFKAYADLYGSLAER